MGNPAPIDDFAERIPKRVADNQVRIVERVGPAIAGHDPAKGQAFHGIHPVPVGIVFLAQRAGGLARAGNRRGGGCIAADLVVHPRLDYVIAFDGAVIAITILDNDMITAGRGGDEGRPIPVDLIFDDVAQRIADH